MQGDIPPPLVLYSGSAIVAARPLAGLACSGPIPTILKGGDTPLFLVDCGPEGPAAGAKHPHAAEGREGERSETLVPEATDQTYNCPQLDIQ